MKTIDQLSEAARQLANDLFRNENELVCANQKTDNQEEGKSCLQKEEERKLTAKEVRDGWTRRPFWAYDHNKMCNACQAYWLVEMAAQTLHVMHCNSIRVQAQKKAQEQSLEQSLEKAEEK